MGGINWPLFSLAGSHIRIKFKKTVAIVELVETEENLGIARSQADCTVDSLWKTCRYPQVISPSLDFAILLSPF